MSKKHQGSVRIIKKGGGGRASSSTVKIISKQVTQLSRQVNRAVETHIDQHLTENLLEWMRRNPIDRNGKLVAVVVPVLSRPARVPLLVDSFRQATSLQDATLYFVAQHSDVAEVAAIRQAGFEPLLVTDADRSWAKKINRGYERTDEPWVLLGADDLSFHSGWLDRIRELLFQHPGVIGTNDLGHEGTRQGTHSTHPLVNRFYANIMGTVDERNKIVHEGYDHNFPDTELVATARKRGLYIHRTDCIIEHLHPLWGKSVDDSVYALGRKKYAVDSGLFQYRKRKYGF